MDATPLFAAVRILVVDDSRPWRESICTILHTRANLYVAGHAEDGLDAVRKASELKPDLILLDIGLPSLDGIKAATRVFQAFPGMRIIFLTQYNDPEIVKAAIRTGAQGYVVKSDAGTEILAAIDSVLRGNQFFSSQLAGHSPAGTANE